MQTEAFPPRPSRRGRTTLIIGAVITAVSLVVGVTAAVVIGKSIGRPLVETFSNKALTTPLDTTLTLRQGRYTVFEQTGKSSVTGTSGGTDPSLDSVATSIGPADVQVLRPDGTAIPTSELGGSETINRDGYAYAGVVRFVTPRAGEYKIRVTTAQAGTVVIAPALGSGFRAALAWVGAGFLSGLGFFIGVVLLIVGAIRRARRPATDPAAPAKGWYPAPDTPGKQRYWDGRAWTEFLR